MEIEPETKFEENEIKRVYRELSKFNESTKHLYMNSMDVITQFHQLSKYTPEMQEVVSKCQELIKSIHELNRLFYCT